MSFMIMPQQEPSAGSVIGQGLYQGIQQGMQRQQTLADQARQSSLLQQALTKAGNDPNAQANAIIFSALPDETKRTALQAINVQSEVAKRSQEIGVSQQKQSMLSNLLNSLGGNAVQPSQQQSANQAAQSQQTQSRPNALPNFLGQPSVDQNQPQPNFPANDQQQATAQVAQSQASPVQITPAQAAALELVQPGLGRTLLQANKDPAELAIAQRKLALEEEKTKFDKQMALKDYSGKEADRAWREIEPTIKEVNDLRSSLPALRASTNAMEDALNSQDLSFFTLDNLAEKIPHGLGEVFRSAAGGSFKSASKNYFLNNIGPLGSRPNQWAEQQVMNALAIIGRSYEGNMCAVELQKFNLDVDEKRIATTDAVSDLQETKHGHKLASLPRDVSKQMDPWIKTRTKELADRLNGLIKIDKEKRHENGKYPPRPGTVRMYRKSDGKALDVPTGEVEEAKTAGATF